MQLYGKGGVTLILIMVFMAVTSAGSAEFVAVSSLISYDVFKTYVDPNAQGKRVRITRSLCPPTLRPR